MRGLTQTLVALIMLYSLPVAAGEGQPDVVVIVDTSITMRHAGMDQKRTSLLLTKLLVDIVPGKLSVIRLLDLSTDSGLLPNKPTGRTGPCAEDPSRQCSMVEQAVDWAQKSRKERHGVKERPTIGDTGFKQMLESHLEQKSHNSQFYLAFWAAKGVFEKHAAEGYQASKKTVIWLSDGKDESGPGLRPALDALRADGVAIVTIVFGRGGDPGIARRHGLEVDRVSAKPSELMKAFAQGFRGIVDAPYRIDNQLAVAPEFRMRSNVEEAWVVIYGDKSLAGAEVDGPDGRFAADYAADLWPAAGAYRVVHLIDPKAGLWQVSAVGGGHVAYAVIQRSSLTPVLLEPRTATADTQTRLVAGVRTKHSKDLVTEPEVLSGATMHVSLDNGPDLVLKDDGQGADQTAGDGRFSAWHPFHDTGVVGLQVSIDSPFVVRTSRGKITVGGIFHYQGGPLDIDFGELTAPTLACRQLPTLQAEHKGAIPFVLESLQSVPTGHRFYLSAGNQLLHADGAAATLLPGTTLELCFESGADAPNSDAVAEPWLRLRVDGSSVADQRIDLRLSWTLHGLSFWQRWGWLILSLLGLLLVIIIALGFIVPKRFPRTPALTLVPELDDIDDMPPLAIYRWPGVGIGFYRDARGYIQGDFRLSGKAQGALASIHAEAGGVRLRPGRGSLVYRQEIDGKWEAVDESGENLRIGQVYRVNDNGPYFKVASRVGGG